MTPGQCRAARIVIGWAIADVAKRSAVSMARVERFDAGKSVPHDAAHVWNAVADATWYYLWVNDSAGVRIKQWYTAEQAGCAGGAGSCSVSSSTTLSLGDGMWWIRTWNLGGPGPWSDSLAFTLE